MACRWLFFRCSVLVTCLACIGISSCSTTPAPTEETKYQEFWPAPPELARYRYVMSIFSSDDIELKSETEQLRELLVGKENPDYQLRRPLDIAVNQGRIYLIDSGSSLVHVFDLQRRRYFNFGFRFQGKLTRPVSLSIDQKGLVYVADRGRNSIIVYDSIGLYVSHINLDSITSQIAGITTDPAGEYIYIVDRGGVDSNLHQVVKIDKQGTLVKQFGQRGQAPGEFNLPGDIVMGLSGELYVLDVGNFRVQVFDGEGAFIKSWGDAGASLGQFGIPRSISVDRDNHLYISDAQFGNIQIFDGEGRLLLPLGQLSGKSGPGQYSLITGITVDQSNYLYVLDQFFNKIDVFQKLDIDTMEAN